MPSKKFMPHGPQKTHDRCHLSEKKFSNPPEILENLITPLAPHIIQSLEKLPLALEKVWPLTKKHRQQLPADIFELSRILTCQRSSLRFPYWDKPAFISAYLYYFLPWNLTRMASVLPNLPIAKPKCESSTPMLLDAGSGPLALPIALWLAQPEWRSLPVAVFATDAARKPLELGKALAQAFAQTINSPIWDIIISTSPIHNLSKKAPKRNSQGDPLHPWLASAANVLNEMRERPAKFKEEEDAEESQGENLLSAWLPLAENGAQLLFIEPGTRLGGSAIMRLRHIALELGLMPLSPCPHACGCPLFEPSHARLAKSWCHFTFSAQYAPAWLKQLSRDAGLAKTSLSLSLLLLAREQRQAKNHGYGLNCRVISQPFETQAGRARYVCSKSGLGLLKNAEKAVSGTLCMAKKPAAPADRDAKSGAIIMEPIAHNKKTIDARKRRSGE